MQMPGQQGGTTHPTGTITFLFTDMEGSTRSREAHPQAMQAAFARQEAVIREAVQANGGYAYKMAGHAFQAAFPTALQALQAAVDAMRNVEFGMRNKDGREKIAHSLAVRMALHTGVTEERDGDYVGPVLNRLARLLAAGHGGQILVSHATEQLLRDNLPTGTTLRDLGEHRLKDLIQPEHIFQVVTEGLREDFPPLNTLDNRPNNLPRQATPFIGRQKEVEAVVALLREPEVALVTLTGPGGIGKTRLALQVAAEALDEQDAAAGQRSAFKDGAWFVDLVALTDPGLVVPTIAYTLGLRETGSEPIGDTLIEYLADKQLLLVLDNFEQVLEAAPQVGDLLVSAPHMKMLVTSRAPLRLSIEREYPVHPLPTPDPKALPSLDQLSHYDAVRLFVQRAQAVRPGFEMDGQGAQAIAEICYRLEGIPLAIELAAARVRALPPQALRARLDSRLKLLTGGPRDLHTRQQTLRNTIEWSYDLLNDGEKQLFRRLAVFRGGCTLEAAEKACEVDVLDGIASLVDKSLMYVVEKARGELRYRMLETIQEYAWEKLAESGEMDVLQHRHALYFVGLAEEAEPRLTSAQQGEWLVRLEDEHDNIRAALRWAGEQSGAGGGDERAASGLRIAGAIWRFWYVRGYLSEGLEQLVRLLDMARASHVERPESAGAAGAERPLDVYRPKALNGAGVLAYTQGEPDAARSLLEECLALSQQLGDKWGVASALTGLGMTAFYLGDYDTSRFRLEESLGIWRQVGDKWGISSAITGLGNTAYNRGDFASARAYHEESLALRREIGDKKAISSSLNNLAAVAQEQGDYASARRMHEEGLMLLRELGDKRGMAYAFSNLGYIAQEQGDYKSARALHQQSLSLLREAGDKWAMAIALGNLGMAAQEEADYESARSLHEESLALRRELQDKYGISASLNNVGLVAFLQEDFATARPLFEESLAISEKLGDKRGIAVTLGNLGNLAASQGDFATARSHYEQCLALRREIGDKRGMVLALAGLGSVAVENAAAAGAEARGELERGTRLLGAVEALSESLGVGLDVDDRLRYECGVASAQAQLTEAEFQKAWQEGRALSLERAIECAFKEK